MGSKESPIVNKRDHAKEDRIPGDAKEILKSLASKWEDVHDPNALQVIPLKGAMTNEVFEIKWPTKTQEVSRKVLMRVYGEGVEVFFNREDEIRTFEFMSKQGQGPRLIARFSNGRIEEFIHARVTNTLYSYMFTAIRLVQVLDIKDLIGERNHGLIVETLSASDLRDPDISALIAAKLMEFHSLEMPGSKKVFLWDRLRNWLKTAKTMCSLEESEAFRLDAIEEEISSVEKELSGDQLIGFCHNDLQYGNIMIDEGTKSITIIDYEYASYNPVAFDIANHFCEMAADYHTDTPHIMDYTKYPGWEERTKFLHLYLSSSGDQPSNKNMEQLLGDVEKYTLASHLFWGLWGIISEHVNDIDFDYMGYARHRFEQYWLRKPMLLGS